jgi:hypothetical protein
MPITITPRSRRSVSSSFLPIFKRAAGADLDVGRFQFTAIGVGNLQRILDAEVNHETGHFDGSVAERAHDAGGAGPDEFLGRRR